MCSAVLLGRSPELPSLTKSTQYRASAWAVVHPSHFPSFGTVSAPVRGRFGALPLRCGPVSGFGSRPSSSAPVAPAAVPKGDDAQELAPKGVPAAHARLLCILVMGRHFAVIPFSLPVLPRFETSTSWSL